MFFFFDRFIHIARCRRKPLREMFQGKLQQQQQQRRRKHLTTLEKKLNRMTRECVEARSIAGETEHLIVWRDGKQILEKKNPTKKKLKIRL